jgi:hypothetical protein
MFLFHDHSLQHIRYLLAPQARGVRPPTPRTPCENFCWPRDLHAENNTKAAVGTVTESYQTFAGFRSITKQIWTGVNPRALRAITIIIAFCVVDVLEQRPWRSWYTFVETLAR